MSNVGRKIYDWYCNGFPSNREAHMAYAVIEAEGEDWMIARTTKGEPVHFDFHGDWKAAKQKLIDEWCFPGVFDLQMFINS